MRIFSVRGVPLVGWSSADPFNFRPRVPTLFWLSFGLFLFGTGEALLIAAGAGVSPWTVLAQGLGRSLGIGIGAATFLVSVAILLLWIPLRQRPGIGTVFNAFIIAATIEYLLPVLPAPAEGVGQLLQAALGTLTVGLGSGIYLVANLGPGPRDGLMTGLQRLTGYPIAGVRTCIEIAVIGAGWALGGTVGLGTVLFAFGIGPAVSVGLYLTALVSGAPVRPETR